MNVIVASTFRDSTGYLNAYLDQCENLADALAARGDSISFVWGEGDSTDDTRVWLEKSPLNASVPDVSTGHRFCPSTEDSSERWANVARFCNLTLDACGPCDVLVWAESDLLWTVDTALALIDEAAARGEVVGAPMWRRDGIFYDRWSVRKDGAPWTPPRNEGLIHVDSACGLFAVPGHLTTLRFPAEDACRGWTRAMGGVWLDTNREAVHP